MTKKVKKQASIKLATKTMAKGGSSASPSSDLSVGQLIKSYREKVGMTQKALSDQLGYENPQFVSLIENGHSKVPLNVLGKVIATLNIPEKKIVESLLSTYEQEIRSEINTSLKKKSS